MDTLIIGIILIVIVLAIVAYRINSVANDEYRRYLRNDATRGQEQQLREFRDKTRKENAHLNKRPNESDNSTEDKQMFNY